MYGIWRPYTVNTFPGPLPPNQSAIRNPQSSVCRKDARLRPTVLLWQTARRVRYTLRMSDAAPLSKVQALKAALAEHGLSPRKIFGQNFMLDTNFAAAVAREAGPDARTLILEMGPGTGCLTRALLDAHPQSRILAIEIDRGLAALLRETFSADLAAGRLTLLEGDALESKHLLSVEFVREALALSAHENRPRRVLCANLPYNIATPVLMNLALDEQGLGVELAVATIQLELAQRMFAPAGDDAYGALSVTTALRANGRIVRRVGPEIFWPRPGVDSALVRLEFGRSGSGLTAGETQAFQQFLQRLFSQRRKTLRAALKPTPIPDLPGVRPDARAEDLAPLTLLELFRSTQKISP